MKRHMWLLVASIISSFSILFGLSFIWLHSTQATSPTGNIIHVPGDYLTIQGAINASASGDTILVASGTYSENIDFLTKDITITSEIGPQGTIIDGGHLDSVVYIGPFGKLIGFKITNGYGIGAGANVSGGGSILRDNIFDNNQQEGGYYGAAISGNNASPIVEGNIFVNNSCDSQFISGVVSFVNSSEPEIINNIFVDNPCRAINMTLPVGNSPLVTNNTIVSNSVGIRVDARINTGAHLYRNNIIVGNDVGLEVEFGSPPDYPTWEFNLVYNNGSNYAGIPDQSGLNGNISDDPQFVDPLIGLYHLLPPSPAIDAGVNVDCPDTDFRDIPRPIDGDMDGDALCDIGAYEYAAVPVSSTMIEGPSTGDAQASYIFTATVSPISATLPITYVWQASGQAPVTHTGGLEDTIVHAWDTLGPQVLTVTASNLLSTVTDTHTITITEVPISGLIATNDGPTPLGSATTLAAAISAGSNVSYTWDFGDESFGSGAVVTHTYPLIGVFTGTVTAVNSVNTLIATTVIAVVEPIEYIYLPVLIKECSLEYEQIAFSSQRGEPLGPPHIFVMNTNGTCQASMSSPLGDASNPAWSPDGSKIAFSSSSPGDYEIYVINANGTGQTNLTNDPGGDYSPTWSPNGSKIAFTSDRDGNGDIYMMNADGTGQTNLTDNPGWDDEPDWSPDGSKIAFTSWRDGNTEIYVMNADGTGQTNLTNGPEDDWGPTWSPDGSKIAFSSSSTGSFDIYVMNADGSDRINLTNDPVWDGSPAWSPDGSRIAYASGDGNAEIYLMNADGTAQTNLTNDPGHDLTPAWRPGP